MDGWEAPEFSLDSEPEMPVGLSVRRLSSSLETGNCVLGEIFKTKPLVWDAI